MTMGRRFWHVLGALAGFALGLADFAILRFAGITMEVDGADATTDVGLLFALTFAGLGFAVGRLLQLRAQAADDARTIRRQLDDLAASQQAVVQQEKLAALGRLSAGIAHEVRNPLGVIRASAALIHDDLPPDRESRRACRFITSEIDRLDGLIAALLAFARPAPLRRSPGNLRAVTDRALALAGGDVARRHIDLRLEHDAADAVIEADTDLVTQLLLGLLGNAAEAVGDGGAIVVRTAAHGEVVHIEVADSGPGLSSEAERYAFEPFFTTKPAGTGLGLAMALRIATAHGGAIEFRRGSGVGPGRRGACVRLTLPRARPAVGAHT
jgi:two-component system sensor histidine kinase HydH